MTTGARLLVETLLEQGSSIGFGVPGESYLAVLDALYDHGDAFRFINTRHEGGAAFMAEAYGKLTNTPGIAFVTRGPGATNAAIGVHTAMQNSSPMILFVGQIETGMRDREAFQELDYRAVFGSMAKWVVEIDHADRVPELVARAFMVAQSGRPGPVVVALPEDMLVATSEARTRGPVKPIRPAPDDVEIGLAHALLSRAKRPVVVAGGGGWTDEGRAALQRFAEASRLPVVVTFRNQDCIDGRSPSYVGDAGFGLSADIREVLGEADLLLVIGPRFGETLTDGYQLFDPATFEQRLVHIHASEAELGKVFTPDLAILSDPNRAAQALAELPPVDAPWAERTAEFRARWEAGLDVPAQPGTLDMGKVMAHLRERLPQDCIVTNGAGNFAIWPGRHLHLGGGRTMLAPQAGSMGAGVPAAVMAKIVAPERMVVCFAGDGDFQMNGQELGTAQQYGAAPIVLLINNGTYGTIRLHQEREYPGRVSGTDIVNPNFVQIAQAYGFHAERIEHTADFAAAFERAAASPTGALLELVIATEALSPRATVESVRAAAKAKASGMAQRTA